ncbi:MAG: UvrD-helicase domain-containing protein [Phycisphaerales bacterium]
MTQGASVILASAGSGKTFELAGRYIHALQSAAGQPDRILATTFTRKAAGEMLAKVLDRLIETSRGNKVAAVGLDIDAKRAKELALGLVRQIDRVRVQTLDSYFAEIGRYGAGELGLTPGWRILDEVEVEEKREEAIDALCRRLDAKSLLAIIESMTGGALPMLPRAELLSRAVTLHAALIDGGGSTEKWGAIAADEEAILDSSDVSVLLSELRAMPPMLKADRTVHSPFANARASVQEDAANGDWQEFHASNLVQAAVGGGSFSKLAIPERMATVLQLLDKHAVAKVVADLAEQSHAAGVMIQGFDRAFTETKKSSNSLTFDDVPRLMLSLTPEEREWITFRMDGKVDHILLDEFQDTSRVQYRVLEPVLSEIASGGVGRDVGTRSIFAVGDIKQSLYSWRGAVPELLEGLSNRLMLGAPETRAKSWRSSQAVLDAVNDVFGSVATNTALEKHAKAAERWATGFQKHVAASDLDGLARLEQVRLAEDDDDAIDLVIDRAVERVKELSAAHPEWSIAVLTRTNDAIPRMIHRLKKVDILASQERGHPLMDDACVSAVVSLLQLAEHPGDSASQFHVAKTSLAKVVGMTSALEASVGERVASETRARIARDGLSGLIAFLRSVLGPELTARAAARMEHLERLAGDFDGRPGGRIPEFIRLVQETSVVDPSAGKVSVLTVHKAKGLEWDAVVLIDLGRKWNGRVPEVVVDRGEAGEFDPLAPVQAVTLWPGAKVQDCDARLEAVAARWNARGVREAISGLYVAMTRAKRQLEMILVNEGEKYQQLGSGKVLRAAVGSPSLGDEAGELFRWEHTAEKREARKPKPVDGGTTMLCDVKFGADRRDSRGGVAPSKKVKQLDVGVLLRDPTANLDARRRGDVWHAWMESVEWAEDRKADDATLIAIASEFGLLGPECLEQISLFHDAMRGPIGDSLARSRYTKRDGTLRVAREWPLAWSDEGIVKGRIDRVVVGLESGRPAWAEILDFKTDNVTATKIESALDGYRGQIDAYRRAVARALRLDLGRVNGVLLFVKPGVVAEVSSPGQNSEG